MDKFPSAFYLQDAQLISENAPITRKIAIQAILFPPYKINRYFLPMDVSLILQ